MKNLFLKFENSLKKWYNLLIYFSKELNTQGDFKLRYKI